MPYDTPYNRMIANEQERKNRRYADMNAYSNEMYNTNMPFSEVYKELRLPVRQFRPQRAYISNYDGGITNRNMEGSAGVLRGMMRPAVLNEDVRPVGMGYSGGINNAAMKADLHRRMILARDMDKAGRGHGCMCRGRCSCSEGEMEGCGGSSDEDELAHYFQGPAPSRSNLVSANPNRFVNENPQTAGPPVRGSGAKRNFNTFLDGLVKQTGRSKEDLTADKKVMARFHELEKQGKGMSGGFLPFLASMAIPWLAKKAYKAVTGGADRDARPPARPTKSKNLTIDLDDLDLDDLDLDAPAPASAPAVPAKLQTESLYVTKPQMEANRKAEEMKQRQADKKLADKRRADKRLADQRSDRNKKEYAEAEAAERAEAEAAVAETYEHPSQFRANAPKPKKEGDGKKRAPSKWIMFVKKFASDKKINYRDALRHPEIKSAYAKVKGKGVSGGSVLSGPSNDPVNKGKITGLGRAPNLGEPQGTGTGFLPSTGLHWDGASLGAGAPKKKGRGKGKKTGSSLFKTAPIVPLDVKSGVPPTEEQIEGISNIVEEPTGLGKKKAKKATKEGGMLKTLMPGSSFSGGKKKREPNAWIKHVQAYAKEHGVSYKDAIKQARASYKKK